MDQLNRREFLSSATGLGISAALGVGTLGAAQAFGANRGFTWEIEAARVVQTFNDGSTMPQFRYRSLAGTPSAGEIPLLEAPEHSQVELRVTNNLTFDIQPMIVGRKTGPPIAPGQVRTLDFKMPRSGMFLLTDALLGVAAGPAGLAAMLVSRRVPERSIHAGWDYDREYFLLYNDTDDSWNNAIDAGQTPDTSSYAPNYHTVNGLTFPDTAADADTTIVCKTGENVLIRCANMGHVRQALHLHGYHAEIVARNNREEAIMGPKDTIPLPGHSTVDLILPVTQPGVFPMHPHSLTTVTDNGLYPHGQILQIIAS